MKNIQSNPCWRIDASVQPIGRDQHHQSNTSFLPTARRPEHLVRFSGTFTSDELPRMRDALDDALNARGATG